MGHWLRYRITQNVPTLSTQSSQAKNLALSIFAATFTKPLLMFLFRPQTKITPNYQTLPLIIGQLLQQKYTNMAYPGKFDHIFAVKH